MLTEGQAKEEIRFCTNMTARCVARQMLDDSESNRRLTEYWSMRLTNANMAMGRVRNADRRTD